MLHKHVCFKEKKIEIFFYFKLILVIIGTNMTMYDHLKSLQAWDIWNFVRLNQSFLAKSTLKF
jgi:hypothetical protein